MLWFQKMMIEELNVQPGLLLANAWVVINAFDLVCSLSGIKRLFELFFGLFKCCTHIWSTDLLEDVKTLHRLGGTTHILPTS